MFAIVLRFIVTVASIPLCAQYMAGVHASDTAQAMLVGVILAAIYLLLRPLMRLVLAVFNFCTLGILNILLDAWLLQLAANLTGSHVTFDDFWWALAAAVVITALRLIVDIFTGKVQK